MNKIFCLFIGLLFVCSWNIAQAGWYKTKWGMTIDDIRMVLNEDIKETSEIDKQRYGNANCYMISNYKIDQFDFKVLFFLDNQEKLQEVRLVKNGNQDAYVCFLDLETELKKKYGKPSNVEDKERRLSSTVKQREWIIEDTIIRLNFVMLWFDNKAHEETNIIYLSRNGIAEDKL